MFVELFGMLECSVLTWAPAGEVPVTCLRGGFSPRQGGGQNTPGHRDCLRVNCRHVFANTVRYIYIYMLFASWEVRIVKNCDRGLENAGRGFRLIVKFCAKSVD